MKHIMLMFLSDIKTVFDKGQLMISDVCYKNLTDGFGATLSTNESAIRYLLHRSWDGNEIKQIDKLFVFLSEKVQKEYISKLYKDEKSGQHNMYYYSEAGIDKWTHWEFFKHSLGQRNDGYILQNLQYKKPDDVFQSYPYCEEADSSSNMTMVVGMAQQIQQYISDNNEEVVLHVDLSGGKRHVSIMMLELMRLMEYNGVKIGYVLYSDYISKTSSVVVEATNIYQFFNLIAGAEEFVQFGSVEAIMAYYKEHTDLLHSRELDALLNAMEMFADEIKLCHRKSFIHAIDCLSATIHQFEITEKIYLGDQLMGQMMWRIKEEYKELLQSGKSDLMAIRWCVQHGYLQQALTLYNEVVPEYLFRKRVVELTVEGRQEVQKACRKDHRSESFYALNEYAITDDDTIANQKLEFYNKQFKIHFCNLVRKIKKRHYTVEMAMTELNEFVQTVPHLQYGDYKSAKAGIEFAYGLKYHLDTEFTNQGEWYTKIVHEYRKGKASLTVDELQALSESDKAEILLDYLQAHLTENSAIRLFGGICYDYARRTCWLIQAGKLCVHIPLDAFGNMMNRYGRLKAERNISNHAKLSGSGFTVDELETYITDGITELEAL